MLRCPRPCVSHRAAAAHLQHLPGCLGSHPSHLRLRQQHLSQRGAAHAAGDTGPGRTSPANHEERPASGSGTGSATSSSPNNINNNSSSSSSKQVDEHRDAVSEPNSSSSSSSSGTDMPTALWDAARGWWGQLSNEQRVYVAVVGAVLLLLAPRILVLTVLLLERLLIGSLLAAEEAALAALVKGGSLLLVLGVVALGVSGLLVFSKQDNRL